VVWRRQESWRRNSNECQALTPGRVLVCGVRVGPVAYAVGVAVLAGGLASLALWRPRLCARSGAGFGGGHGGCRSRAGWVVCSKVTEEDEQDATPDGGGLRFLEAHGPPPPAAGELGRSATG
jgi:hypothetical protein